MSYQKYLRGTVDVVVSVNVEMVVDDEHQFESLLDAYSGAIEFAKGRILSVNDLDGVVIDGAKVEGCDLSFPQSELGGDDADV